MTTNYNADSIKTMSFGEAANARIGMYLSADTDEAIFLGYREIICNSNDEHAMGYGNKITTIIDSKKRTISVEDEGRGIPVGIRKDGSNSLIAALTIPHTGAKLDSDTYAGAIGTNGIGSSIVAHTSSWLDAEVKAYNGHYKVHFEGTAKTGATTDGVVTITEAPQKKTGTKITYSPNPETYKDSWIKKEQVIEFLTQMSYFNPGLTYILDFDGDKKTILSKNGLVDALKENKAIHKNILHKVTEIDGVRVELALQWCKTDSEIKPYANSLFVPDGGQFYTGFKTSLTKAFNTALGTDFSGEIIRKYLDGYVSVTVGIPQFSNQAKTALANPEARTACAKATTDAIKEFFAKNKKDGEQIKELLEKEQKAEKAAQRAREAEKTIVTGKKVKMLTNLPPKLADATGKGYRELFLTEGK